MAEVGRPRRWKTVDELEKAIEAYFLDAIANEQPLGILALCVHAKMSWDCFHDYERGDMDEYPDEFSGPLKAARLRIMAYAESNVYNHTAGATFMLTNLSRNLKNPWKNAQHQELTGANGGPVELSLADQIRKATENG